MADCREQSKEALGSIKLGNFLTSLITVTFSWSHQMSDITYLVKKLTLENSHTHPSAKLHLLLHYKLTVPK
jgi:hypothetical protein